MKTRHLSSLLVVLLAAWLTAPDMSAASYRDKLAAIEREIDAIPQLGEHSIQLDYYAGLVTLTGTVASERVRHEVENAATRVHGISGVVNRLEVAPVASPVDVRARFRGVVSSEDVAQAIHGALNRMSGIPASGIEVEVRNGIATLKGSLADFRQVDQVLATALNVAGVEDVRSELKVAGGSYPARRFLQ